MPNIPLPESFRARLDAVLTGKSEEFRAGFFAAINLNDEMKSAFLHCAAADGLDVVHLEDDNAPN